MNYKYGLRQKEATALYYKVITQNLTAETDEDQRRASFPEKAHGGDLIIKTQGC